MRFYVLQILILLQACLLSPGALAEDLSKDLTANMPIYEVTPESEMQTLIDSAILDVFRSELGQSLCHNSRDPLYWEKYAGVSHKVSDQLTEHCRSAFSEWLSTSHRKKSSFPSWPFSGHMEQKHYFIVPDEQHQFAVQSWTDSQNNTYIFGDSKLSAAELKLIIAHELAMSFDSKNNLDMRAFMYLEGVGPTADDGYNYKNFDLYNSAIFQISPSPKLAPGYVASQNWAQAVTIIKGMMDILNASSTTNFNQTFAVMRALNVERKLLGNEMLTLTNHSECVREFKLLFPFISSLKLFSAKNSGADFWSAYTRQNDENYAPKTDLERQTLIEVMMSSNMVLPIDSHPVFCEYMATPALGGITNNMFTSGPRPRLTGGTGLTMDPLVIKNLNLQIDNQPNKLILDAFEKNSSLKLDANMMRNLNMLRLKGVQP